MKHWTLNVQKKTFLAFNFLVLSKSTVKFYIYLPSMGRISKLLTTVQGARIQGYIRHKLSMCMVLNKTYPFCLLLSTQKNTECSTCTEYTWQQFEQVHKCRGPLLMWKSVPDGGTSQLAVCCLRPTVFDSQTNICMNYAKFP